MKRNPKQSLKQQTIETIHETIRRHAELSDYEWEPIRAEATAIYNKLKRKGYL